MPDPQKLADFVAWVQAHITGDEKGQAQLFLDRLFQAFGHAGSLEVGGQPEFRVRKADEDGGGTSFADFVWKPVVLIEMKKRGANLTKHYRQAFDYWTRLVPGRPRYVVLCNFDEFNVYDFESQMDSPVGHVSLASLPTDYGPLAFLLPGQPKPVFDNEHVAVTRAAAAKLATCFNRLIRRGVPRPLAQRFILQILIVFFAEDIGLLEKYFVTRLLDECDEKTCFDLLGGLFRALNTPGGTAGGRFKGVPYFNGGIFNHPAELELSGPELILLLDAARDNDWSKVQPEIFGTIFEQTLDKDERHAQGAHFTRPVDIMKIVGPTIVEPWRAQIESAKTLTRLNELLDRLSHFRVLDPACGSGNFLYIAYREMKRLEARLFERMAQEFKSEAKQSPGQMRLSFLSAQNFYGLDINPFAVELAKATMMIARKLAIDELHITERALPLDNLDRNFIAADALITTAPDGTPARTPWPAADVIIGNPPFLGAKLLKPQLGPDYVNRLRDLYPEVPGMADYCVYWIRRAHDHLPPCTTADPVAGRAGLVGTQNIRNNKSRVGGLDHVVTDGTIIEAVDNQPWSGEANVHVSVANWVKSKDTALLPGTRRLWYKAETALSTRVRHNRGAGPASKTFELVFRDCQEINSALSDKADVSGRRPLNCNKNPKRCFQGKIPGYEGFLLSVDEARQMHVHEPIVPYLTGRELLNDFRIQRYAIDFENMDMATAARHSDAFEHCRRQVLPAVQQTYDDAVRAKSDMASARKEHLNRWWQFWNRRDELNSTLASLSRYVACSRVSRRPIMVFLSTSICPSDLVQVFGFEDDYSFGILQSAAHFEWFRTSSRMKVETDLRYSVREVFETFPWPQTPTDIQVRAVASAARLIRRVRDDTLGAKSDGGLRGLYRLLELPGRHPLKDAHAELDAAVVAAYGFVPGDSVLEQLMQLNSHVTDAEEVGNTVCPPGVPATFTCPAELVTKDCLRP